MKHWNGISTIPNPFQALSCAFVVKGVQFCPEKNNFEISQGDTPFLRYKPDFFFKVLYNAWGTICQMGIGVIQKKLIKAPPIK